MYLFLIIGISCLIAQDAQGSQSYCDAWTRSTNRVKAEPGLTMQCTNKRNCQGYDCKSTYHFKGTSAAPFLQNAEVDFCYGIELYTKKLGSSVLDLYVDVPEKNVSWDQRFIANSNYRTTAIPGAEYDYGFVTLRPFLDLVFQQTSNILSLQITIKINIEGPFDTQTSPDSLSRNLLNVSFPLDDSTKNVPTQISYNSQCVLPTDWTTLKPTEPSGGKGTTPPAGHPSKSHGKRCDSSNIKACEDPEVCEYREDLKYSVCQCLNGGPLLPSGVCGPSGMHTIIPVTPSKIGVPTTPASNSTSSKPGNNNTLTISLSVCGVLVGIGFIAGLGYYFIKRRRENPYTGRELLLTGDDDDDDPSM